MLFPVLPKLRFRNLSPILILVAGVLAYSNTFHVPFQLDENYHIEDNPFVTGTGGLISEPGSNTELYRSVVQRFIGYLTFIVNYRLHGVRVEGYHIINLAVHLLNAVLLYVIVLQTFETPILKQSNLRKRSVAIASVCALVFVSHPVQTEAVTYIMQRFASLAAFFSLVAVLLYSKARGVANDLQTAPGSVRPVAISRSAAAWYAGSFIAAVFAMKTKENAVILPVLIFLYELCFFRGSIKTRFIWLAPLAMTGLIVPLTTVLLMQGRDVNLNNLASGFETATWSPWSYFLTQMRVVITYYRLLVWPIHQTFIREYPLYTSAMQPAVILSAIIHLAVILGGFLCMLLSQRKDAALRLIAFGIFWFYVALAVESSVIPLPQLMCEYRLYLPSVGIMLAAATGIFFLLRRAGMRSILLLAALPLSLLVTVTYMRNAVWNDAVVLWEDTVRRSPLSALAHLKLGVAYNDAGRFEDAVGDLQKALQLDVRNQHLTYIRSNLGMAYSLLGRSHDAVREYLATLELNPYDTFTMMHLLMEYVKAGCVDEVQRIYPEAGTSGQPTSIDRAGSLSYQCKRYRRVADGQNEAGIVRNDDATGKAAMDIAVREFRRAMQLPFRAAEIHYNLGTVYMQLKQYEKAEKEYRRSINLNPAHAGARNNLAGIYVQTGRYEDARRELLYLAEHDQTNSDIQNNLFLVTERLNRQTR